MAFLLKVYWVASAGPERPVSDKQIFLKDATESVNASGEWAQGVSSKHIVVS